MDRENNRLNRLDEVMFAGLGIFIGTLLADVFSSDGIQADDIGQAAIFAVLAALAHGWLTRKRPE